MVKRKQQLTLDSVFHFAKYHEYTFIYTHTCSCDGKQEIYYVYISDTPDNIYRLKLDAETPLKNLIAPQLFDILKKHHLLYVDAKGMPSIPVEVVSKHGKQR
jgi:hypothetical protein